MQIENIISMLAILAITLGGFSYFLRIAVKKEDKK